MEAEEENLTEEKRLSLGQEVILLIVQILKTSLSFFFQVYSLQLVVEMRTGEVRNLRQQLALANQQVKWARSKS